MSVVIALDEQQTNLLDIPQVVSETFSLALRDVVVITKVWFLNSS